MIVVWGKTKPNDQIELLNVLGGNEQDVSFIQEQDKPVELTKDDVVILMGSTLANRFKNQGHLPKNRSLTSLRESFVTGKATGAKFMCTWAWGLTQREPQRKG